MLCHWPLLTGFGPSFYPGHAGLLDQLQNETPSSAAPTSPTAKRSEEYAPPSEATLLEEGAWGALCCWGLWSAHSATVAGCLCRYALT